MKETGKFNGKRIGLLVFICCLVILFVLDNQQQNRFREVRIGYTYMEEGKYQEAATIFTEYLSSHSSPRYWKLIEYANGVDSDCTYEKVLAALRECEEMCTSTGDYIP